jgi:MFS family permease
MPIEQMTGAAPMLSRPSPTASEAAKLRALPWSMGFSALSSSVFGAWTVFGSVFLLYLQALGLLKAQIGILLSLFPFCGVLAPLVAPQLARWGLKRVCVIAYTGRHAVIGLLLLMPWVQATYGRAATLGFVAGVILIFAVVRAVAETAVYPWTQEFVPDRVRGRYGALSTIFGTLAGIGALAIAGYVIGHGSGVGRFLWLQGAGCLAGLIGTSFLLRVPGGAPVARPRASAAHWGEMREALRDRNFRRFLAGMAGYGLGAGMMAAFMPLLLVEKVGVAPGTVVWLDNAALLGGVLISLPCGWLADRFGSRTVLMPGLTLSLGVIGFWCVMLALGKASLLGVPALAALGLLGGIASNAIALGYGRLLFTGVVPPEKSVAYMAVFYAWVGLTGGLAPLLAGGILSAAMRLSGAGAGPLADGYTLLFLCSLLPAALGWVCFVNTRPDGTHRTRDLLTQLAPRMAWWR